MMQGRFLLCRWMCGFASYRIIGFAQRHSTSTLRSYYSRFDGKLQDTDIINYSKVLTEGTESLCIVWVLFLDTGRFQNGSVSRDGLDKLVSAHIRFSYLVSIPYIRNRPAGPCFVVAIVGEVETDFQYTIMQ